MQTMDLKSMYANQIATLMEQNGLNEQYDAEVRSCTSMQQVFQALSDPQAKHVAVLTKSSEPIQNMFEHIKIQLLENQSVPLALFFELSEEQAY